MEKEDKYYKIVSIIPKEKVLKFNPRFKIFYYTFETLINKLIDYKKTRGVVDPVKEVILSLKRTLLLWNKKKDFIAGWYNEIYPIIQFIISSINARYGNFIERFLASSFDNSEVKVKLGKITAILNVGEYSFKKTRGKTDPNKKEIDMVLVKNNKIFFVEHRTSTEGGGKTGQESVFDKFIIFLEDLQNSPCLFDFISKKFSEIFFVITIFFDKYGKIARLDNPFVRGRIDSLIRYGNDIFERVIPDLIKKEIIKIDGPYNKETIFADWINGKIRIIYKRKHKPIPIYFKLLVGSDALSFYGINSEIIDNEEKFSKYLLEILSETIADDFWILFSVLLNEIKLQKEFNMNKLPIEYIIDYIKDNHKFRKRIFSIIISNDDLEEIWRKLDEEISRELYNIVDYLKGKMGEVRLVESNDISQMLEYVKKEVYVSLMFYRLTHGDIE